MKLISRSTLLHLRFPISLLLLSPFLMGLQGTSQIGILKVGLMFFLLHFLIYPASNGHNSYYDRDEKSIGELENPPAVTPDLRWVSWLFDILGLGLATFVSFRFFLMCFCYSLISHLYSHPRTRFKKFPLLSFLIVVIFQGAWVVAMVRWELEPPQDFFSSNEILLFGIASLSLCGAYPMSQIYQHAEDELRGDLTLSRVLGPEKTWIWSQIFFAITFAMTAFWIWIFQSQWVFLWLFLSFGPMGYFLITLLQKKELIWDSVLVKSLNRRAAFCSALFWLGLLFT